MVVSVLSVVSSSSVEPSGLVVTPAMVESLSSEDVDCVDVAPPSPVVVELPVVITWQFLELTETISPSLSQYVPHVLSPTRTVLAAISIPSKIQNVLDVVEVDDNVVVVAASEEDFVVDIGEVVVLEMVESLESVLIETVVFESIDCSPVVLASVVLISCAAVVSEFSVDVKIVVSPIIEVVLSDSVLSDKIVVASAFFEVVPTLLEVVSPSSVVVSTPFEVASKFSEVSSLSDVLSKPLVADSTPIDVVSIPSVVVSKSPDVVINPPVLVSRSPVVISAFSVVSTFSVVSKPLVMGSEVTCTVVVTLPSVGFELVITVVVVNTAGPDVVVEEEPVVTFSETVVGSTELSVEL